MDVMKQLEEYLLTDVAAGSDKKTIDPDEDLITQGLIDSLGIMKLIGFLDERFGVKVEDQELVPENFQTLKALADLVAKKSR
jgi:acyl carrier protein